MDRTRMQAKVLARIRVEDRGHNTPCWVSTRAAYGKGYTKLGHDGATWSTHRFSYTAFVGDIPEGLQVDHLCRVRACCNPDHLEAVTCRTNLLRGDTITAAEVARTHCPEGHPLSGANLYLRRDRTGRICRTCRDDATRKRRAVTLIA